MSYYIYLFFSFILWSCAFQDIKAMDIQDFPKIPAGLAQNLPTPEVMDVDPAVSETPKNKKKKLPRTIANTTQKALTKYNQEPYLVKMSPGDSQLVYIAQGVNNQIVTPYRTPVVRTANDVQVVTDASSIFVATDQRNYFTLYIYEEGFPDQGVTLSMLPSNIPPKQIRLDINSSHTHLAGARPASSTRVTDADTHVSYMMDLMATLGRGELPYGFQFSKNLTTIDCASPLTLSPYQRIVGSEYEIIVLHARNNHANEEEFLETDCVVEGVTAVSAFPKLRLMPGDETEIFVIRHLVNNDPDPLYRRTSITR